MKNFRLPFLVWALALLTLAACNPKSNPSIYQPDTTEVNSTLPNNEAVWDIVDDYKEKLDKEMDEPIGMLAHDMFNKKPEGELGNFICDAPMDYIKNDTHIAPVDFCLMNKGGIRINHLAAGELTVEDMFEIMPFDNELVIVELTGEPFKQVMARVAKQGGWPISANVNILINGDKIREFLVNGEVVDYSKTYRVLMNNYIANGGDGMAMLTPLKKEKTGILLRDAMIGYCKQKTAQQEPITSRINGRIIVMD